MVYKIRKKTLRMILNRFKIFDSWFAPSIPPISRTTILHVEEVNGFQKIKHNNEIKKRPKYIVLWFPAQRCVGATSYKYKNYTSPCFVRYEQQHLRANEYLHRPK